MFTPRLRCGGIRTGSGALTISLAQAAAPHGQVFTFEFNKDRVEKILQDMKTLGIENLVTASHGDACYGWVFSCLDWHCRRGNA